ncbi:sulfatase [candidate division KSB1 bacterium]|nr:sulfatase [candidate division KSB1 bacterium]
MKNIILIITDTFRYDNLKNNPHRFVRTPELDKFAVERATSIENFYTGSFPTIPHRTDVATGKLGWQHYSWQPIDLSGANHIASILKQAGYVTQLICDCPHLFKARFQHAFDAAFQHRGQEGDKYLLHFNHPIESVMPMQKTRYQPAFQNHCLADVHRWMNRYPETEYETFPAKTGQTALRWLEENSRVAGFFLWVDFFDPHEPWDPPEYLVRRYDPDYRGTPMIHPNYGPATDYSEAELKNLAAHYAAESELVDRWIGRILQKVDDLELWDDTIVVVTADHGISLGEHNRTGKSNIHPKDDRFWPIYPEISHVPFLIAGASIPRGQHLNFIAQPIDILPSLCDLAGIRVAPPDGFDGISFADALLKGKSEHRQFAISGCHFKPLNAAIPEKSNTPFLVTDRWGFAPIGAAGKPELFDLNEDALAARNIADNNRKLISELSTLFTDYLKSSNAPESMIRSFENKR